LISETQKITGSVLVLSLLGLFLANPVVYRWVAVHIAGPSPTPTPFPLPTPTPLPSASPASTPITVPSPSLGVPVSSDSSNNHLVFLVSIVSFVTSFSSFLGFISATILAWRKEKREAESVRIENERQRLETEKLKHELSALRRLGNNPKDQTRRPKDKHKS
jgi:hypothetical protein